MPFWSPAVGRGSWLNLECSLGSISLKLPGCEAKLNCTHTQPLCEYGMCGGGIAQPAEGTSPSSFWGVHSIQNHLHDKLKRSPGQQHQLLLLQDSPWRHGAGDAGGSASMAMAKHTILSSRGDNSKQLPPHTPARLSPAHSPLEGPATTSASQFYLESGSSSSSSCLGFPGQPEEVKLQQLRAALTHLLTIYSFAHLICSTTHKSMQLP